MPFYVIVRWSSGVRTIIRSGKILRIQNAVVVYSLNNNNIFPFFLPGMINAWLEETRDRWLEIGLERREWWPDTTLKSSVCKHKIWHIFIWIDCRIIFILFFNRVFGNYTTWRSGEGAWRVGGGGGGARSAWHVNFEKGNSEVDRRWWDG